MQTALFRKILDRRRAVFAAEAGIAHATPGNRTSV
jgi:hypothetical protein